MSEDDLELKKDINDFQRSLKHQIKSFRKRLIEPGNIQIMPKKIIQSSEEEMEEVWKSGKAYDFIMSILYDHCCNLSLPLSNAKIFRFIHLRTFAVILESASQASSRKSPIEVCFHLRNYLEHAANLSYALDEIIPMSNELLENMKLDSRTHPLEINKLEIVPSKKFIKLSQKLHEKFFVYSLQTNVDTDIVLRGEATGNKSLVPDKSDKLKSIRIGKKLKAFQEKIELFRPTYDLLSEYLHPNSYIFWSATNLESMQAFTEDKPNLLFKDQKLEEGMSVIGYFFQEHNRSYIEEITLMTLKRDSEFLSLQGKISKKMKALLKKLLGNYEYKSDPTYSNALCVCGSNKKLFNCCAS